MLDKLDSFIAPNQRAAIRAPIEEALTLPRHAFISEEFFNLEVERIFSREWVALCFAEQLETAGCLLPIEFAGIPLLVVRGNDDILRVFHNIVPYDGCLAVIERTVQSAIVTPYHGWRYDLEGKLLATPYWQGSRQNTLSTSLNGHKGDLVAVRCEVALGILFIDLSGEAGSLKTALSPMLKQLAEYRIDNLDIGRDDTGKPLFDGEDIATNWKTHYENWAVNVLHEAFTHEIYAQSPQIPRINEQDEKTYIEVIEGAFMALSYREQDFSETYELTDLPFTHLGIDPDTLPDRAFIGSLFPNLHMAVFPYFIHFIIAHPVNAGRTKTLRAQFYEVTSATDPDYFELRVEHMQEFQQAGREDARITEAVQKARRSRVCTQQFYSPFWDTMHYTFSNSVLSALERNIS